MQTMPTDTQAENEKRKCLDEEHKTTRRRKDGREDF